MTDPIRIPLLNAKLDAEGNPVPITHADLPPAAGIANTMTVHEHVTILQRLQNMYNELLDAHLSLKAERSDPSNTDGVVDSSTIITAEPQAATPKSEATASTSTESEPEPIPASQPAVFTPKVPA